MARRERVWVVMVLGLVAMALLFLAAPATPGNADNELAAALESTLKSEEEWPPQRPHAEDVVPLHPQTHGYVEEKNRPVDEDAAEDLSQGSWPSGAGQEPTTPVKKPSEAEAEAEAEAEPTEDEKEGPATPETRPSPPPVREESVWPDEDEDEDEKPKNIEQGLPTSPADYLPKKPNATSGAKDEQKDGGKEVEEEQKEPTDEEGEQDNNDARTTPLDEEAERGEGTDPVSRPKDLTANEADDSVGPNEGDRPTPSTSASSTTTSTSTSSTTITPTMLNMTDVKDYTLVIYVYWEKNPTYIENLNYFLRVGVPSAAESQRAGVTHLVIVQGRQLSPAVKVPSHVLVWRRPNTCFDYGAVGQALRSVRLNLPTFRRYVILNASVKGPYLPAYWPRDVHWSTIFTNRLSDRVKLVGTSIVCLPDSDKGKLGPRVEGFFWATDYIGIELGFRRGVFNCFRKKDDVVIHGEYGMSRAILEANYTIDSMQLKYQGVDWTDRGNWNCNNFVHPTRANAYDGINMHPLETVFHKRSWTDINVDVLPGYMDRYAQWKYDQQTRESGVARPPV